MKPGYGLTSLSDLADDLGTTSRTLRRAARDGALDCRRTSPRRSYVSGRELEYLRSHWPLIAGLRAGLRTEPNVASAVLFGSAARGDDAPGADSDLLVEFRDEDWRAAIALSARLSERVGREVEVISLAEAERNQSLLAEAVADGRPLVDRVGRWAELRARESEIRARANERDQAIETEARAVLAKASA